MRNVLIVGAGKLGKGFLGEVFDAAKDWKVSFLDKDPRVIENLKKPVCRVGAPFVPVPFGPNLESCFVPDSGNILEAAHRILTD